MKQIRALPRVLSVLLSGVLAVSVLLSTSSAAEAPLSTRPLLESVSPSSPETVRRQSTAGELSLEELAVRELPAEEIPEVLAGEIPAGKEHVVRLREQENDLNTVIFQNKDGSKTMYSFAQPVKYTDESGTVRDKKTTLSTDIRKAVYREDYAFVSDQNDVKTYFPETLDRDTGVLLESGDIAIECRPLFSRGRNFEDPAIQVRRRAGDVVFPEALPVAEWDAEEASAVRSVVALGEQTKDCVDFKGVFDDAVTLRYAATLNGFKEEILLERYTGVNTFAFELDTHGLRLELDGAGCLLTDPDTGEAVGTVGALVVYDASGGAAPGPLEYRHTYEVETVTPNQRYILTAVVDEAFLLDEDTVYPVTIDPSVEVQSYRGEMIKNIEDVPLYNGRANHTHGSNAYNVIGRMDYWSGVYHGTGRTLVRFPGLISNFAYQCLDPDDITAVRYVMRENSGKSGTSQIDAYFFKEYWSEGAATYCNVNWNNYDSLLCTASITGPSGSWASFDITAAAKAWLAESRDWRTGILLKNRNESTTSAYRSFASTEFGSTLPYVVIEYTRRFYASVENYYDGGYAARYAGSGSNSPANVIAANMNWVAGIYNQVFNLSLIYNAYPSPYTSLADLCDKASFDDLCPHGTHARPSDVLNAFIRDHPGDETEIRILWSGHRLTSNRSYTSYNHYSIFIHDLPDLDIRTEDERYTLLHETAHQFGAPDHYCYDPSQEDSCGNDLCPSHHEEQGLTENCVMGKYIGNISSWDPDDIFCDYCKSVIVAHLGIHH